MKACRVLITLALLALAAFLPRPAYAERPDGATAAFTPPHYCNDVDELAGVLMVEGGNQPQRDIIRMAQILKAEADARGLTICALTHLTNFTTVRRYADAYPDSYAARQLTAPPDWLIQLSGDVLVGRYEDMRGGATHFDGTPDGMRIVFSH